MSCVPTGTAPLMQQSTAGTPASAPASAPPPAAKQNRWRRGSDTVEQVKCGSNASAAAAAAAAAQYAGQQAAAVLGGHAGISAAKSIEPKSPLRTHLLLQREHEVDDDGARVGLGDLQQAREGSAAWRAGRLAHDLPHGAMRMHECAALCDARQRKSEAVATPEGCPCFALTSRTNASCASTQSFMLGSLAELPDTTLLSADRLALAKSCSCHVVRHVGNQPGQLGLMRTAAGAVCSQSASPLQCQPSPPLAPAADVRTKLHRLTFVPAAMTTTCT